MTGYGRFARFYDDVMGERRQARTFIQELIHENAPEAKSVLDLACGTGTLIKHLSPKYEVYGLDASRAMLAVARRKVPEGRFFRQDMASFRLPRKFDIILCIFDSLNHLLTFAAWKKVFGRVHSHLNPRGLFVFDINTVSRLRRLKAETPWIAEFGRNYLILRVEGSGPAFGIGRSTSWNTQAVMVIVSSEPRSRSVHFRFRKSNAPSVRVFRPCVLTMVRVARE